MYKAYNLCLSDDFYNPLDYRNFKEYLIQYAILGDCYLSEQQKDIDKIIKKYAMIQSELIFDKEEDEDFTPLDCEKLINNNYDQKASKSQTIDALLLEKDWFKDVDADIFISHSHKDKDLAMGLAWWLNRTFGLNCFIDSKSWGYADKLLNKLCSKYAKKNKIDGTSSFNYKTCMDLSKNVYTLLSMALQKMIDKTEVTFIINTENSIQQHTDEKRSTTNSPWIYTEITCTKIIRRKPLPSNRTTQSYMKMLEASSMMYMKGADIKMEFLLPLEHLHKINDNKLYEWKEKYTNNPQEYISPFDALYLLTKD